MSSRASGFLLNVWQCGEDAMVSFVALEPPDGNDHWIGRRLAHWRRDRHRTWGNWGNWPPFRITTKRSAGRCSVRWKYSASNVETPMSVLARASSGRSVAHWMPRIAFSSVTNGRQCET